MFKLSKFLVVMQQSYQNNYILIKHSNTNKSVLQLLRIKK